MLPMVSMEQIKNGLLFNPRLPQFLLQNQDLSVFLRLPRVPSIFSVYPICCYLFGADNAIEIHYLHEPKLETYNNIKHAFIRMSRWEKYFLKTACTEFYDHLTPNDRDHRSAHQLWKFVCESEIAWKGVQCEAGISHALGMAMLMHHFGSDCSHGLQWKLAQTFVAHRRWILLTLVFPFFWHHHQGHICGFNWNISTTTGWITMKFGTNIHNPFRTVLNNFSDQVSFHLASLPGQNFYVSKTPYQQNKWYSNLPKLCQSANITILTH